MNDWRNATQPKSEASSRPTDGLSASPPGSPDSDGRLRSCGATLTPATETRRAMTCVWPSASLSPQATRASPSLATAIAERVAAVFAALSVGTRLRGWGMSCQLAEARSRRATNTAETPADGAVKDVYAVPKSEMARAGLLAWPTSGCGVPKPAIPGSCTAP